MTALVAMGSFIPGERVPIESLAERFELTPMQVRVFRRYHKIGSAGPFGGGLLDLLRQALTDLALSEDQARRVRYVLYARTFPVVVPYPHNPLHEVCAAFGLAHAQAFAVGQHACASGLLAIDLAGRLLAGDADPDSFAPGLAPAGDGRPPVDDRLAPVDDGL